MKDPLPLLKKSSLRYRINAVIKQWMVPEEPAVFTQQHLHPYLIMLRETILNSPGKRCM